MNAMNITSSILRRPCLCVLAGGLVFSSAAAAEPQKVPKALPVGPNEDSRVYMIVEDPVVPEGTRIIRPQVIEQPRNVEVRPARRASSDNDDDDDDDRRAATRPPRDVQVIEVVPTAPVAPEVTTRTTTTKTKTNPSSSSSKSKSRSRDSQRGKTQHLETPEPSVQVQPPQSTETRSSTSSSKMKIESGVPSEAEPPAKKTSSTVRTRASDRSDDESAKITEVQRSQEKTKASETQVQTVQENPPAAPARLPSTASSTTVAPGRPNTTVLPVAPIPTTAETRQPLPEPLIPSRSTVTQQEQVTTQRIEDTPPPSPSQPPVTEAPVSRVNGDPLDTTPAPGSTPETAVNEKAPASFPKVETTTVEDPTVNGPGANANLSANVKQETQTTSSTTKTKEPATDKTAAASSKPTGTKEAPLAEKTETEGLVKSPYPPHKMIDVRGMASGTLAKDPTTQEVFRVP
jgi:hypothetical protein